MKFQSIVAGTDFTCALTPAGRAWCWGLGRDGELGNGLAANSLVPVEVSGGLTFRSLAASGQSVCGLTIDGAAFCWGSNLFGTLGDGTGYLVDGVLQRPSPVAVVGGHTFAALAAGFETMCGVSPTGLGYCWGYNNGVVGDGTIVHRAVPTLVAGGLTWRSISPGTGFACGVTTADAVFCWGSNTEGELGDGSLLPHLTPQPVRWP
jgi:alpha-tubulin suppressor-like RCC1 family protein